MTHDRNIRDYCRRFNLRLLKRVTRSVLPNETERIFQLSRRSFLGLSALVTLRQVLRNFSNSDEFTIARDGDVLHVALDHEHRWTIDPSFFGPEATLEYTRAPSLVRIALRNGFFPGTRARADFTAALQKVAGVWKISIRLLRGTTFRSELLPWLRGTRVAVANWSASSLQFIPGLRLHIPLNARIHFTPDWS
jgi:hypothetical protein